MFKLMKKDNEKNLYGNFSSIEETEKEYKLLIEKINPFMKDFNLIVKENNKNIEIVKEIKI